MADPVQVEDDEPLAHTLKLVAPAEDLGKDVPSLKERAEQVLRAVRTLRVGKVAPEIAAGDLDGKEFKLSDYRGKVVVLDFWGDW